MSASRKYRPLRLSVLTAAFVLIVAAPILNSTFQFSFVQGWYQSISIGNLWFVSPLEGLESILTSRTLTISLVIGMALPIIVALLLGRVFCSWICPVSFLSEVYDMFLRLVTRKRFRKSRLSLPRRIFWWALICELLLAMIAGVPLFVFLSPPGLVGREIMMMVLFKTVAIEGVVVVAVLLMHAVSPRFFCRYLCPLGSLLGFLGARRRFYVEFDVASCIKCGMCKRACPLGLEPKQEESLTAYCWNCGECIDACESDALSYTWRKIALDSTPPLVSSRNSRQGE